MSINYSSGTKSSVNGGLGVFTLASVIFFVLFLSSGPITLQKVLLLAGAWGVCITLMALTVVFLAKRDEARVRRVLAGDYWAVWQYETEQVQVYLGPLGICWVGSYPQLIDFGDELIGVSVLEQDGQPTLQFEFYAKRWSAVGFSMHSKIDFLNSLGNLCSHYIARTLVTNVPIPVEHEAEAEEVAERFRVKLAHLPFGSVADRWLGVLLGCASILLFCLVGILIT